MDHVIVSRLASLLLSSFCSPHFSPPPHLSLYFSQLSLTPISLSPRFSLPPLLSLSLSFLAPFISLSLCRMCLCLSLHIVERYGERELCIKSVLGRLIDKSMELGACFIARITGSLYAQYMQYIPFMYGGEKSAQSWNFDTMINCMVFEETNSVGYI